MKKVSLFICLVLFFISFACSISYSLESNFSNAIKTCQKYSKSANLKKNGEIYNLTISLESKGNTCVYKEKITMGADFALLSCNLPQTSLEYISGVMEQYNDDFKSEIEKQPIYEAKMSNNNLVFQKYLADPHYCKITNSYQKNSLR